MRIKTPNWILAILAIGWIASAPLAQEPGAQQTIAQDKGAQERLAKLDTAYKARVREAYAAQVKAIEAAKDSGAKSLPAVRMGPSKELVIEYIAAHKTAAADYAGTDGAIGFHIWIARIACSVGKCDEARAALDTLTTVHIDSSALSELPRSLARISGKLGEEDTQSFLAVLKKKSPHTNIKASAIYYGIDRTLRSASTTSQEYAKARTQAQRAMKLSKDSKFKAHVQGVIDGREKIVKGQVAPDIIGVDLDGVSFKLSDYRGKIVMLDFWGDW